MHSASAAGGWWVAGGWGHVWDLPSSSVITRVTTLRTALSHFHDTAQWDFSSKSLETNHHIWLERTRNNWQNRQTKAQVD